MIRSVLAACAMTLVPLIPITASAQSRCVVADPSDTPLNVRTAPYGRIINTLEDGYPVTIIDRSYDREGKPWVYVADASDNQPLGWVYRQYISCRGS